MKPNQSSFDRVVTSLLTGIAGAGFGMLPWMMDAEPWWVFGCSAIGFSLAAITKYFLGDSIERFDKRNQESWTRTLLFNSAFGLIPALIGILIGLLVAAIYVFAGRN